MKKSKVVTNSKLPPTFMRLDFLLLFLVGLFLLLRISGCDPAS